MSSITCAQTKNVHLLSAASKKIMKYQNIAPAPSLTASTSNSTAGEETKARKYSQRTVAYSSDPTQSVLRRNARERNRVKQVNNSFARLRQHIPQTIIADLTKSGGRGPHKKISKVDTLRIAVEYIRRLQDLLEDLNCNNSSNAATSSQQYSNNNLLNTNTTDTTATASNNNSNNSKVIVDSTLTTFTSNPTNLIYYPAQTANTVVEVLNRNLLETTPTSVQSEQLNFHHSTTLLSPISLSSYSPQHNSSTQLDNDCNSPTSSFNSNLSFDSGTYDHNSQPEHQKQRILPPQVMCPPEANLESNLQLKFEPYENFHLDDDDCTPDDEEILDYISLWQDQ